MDELLLLRRIEKFGNIEVNQMSATTRKYFKKHNHRKADIVKFEASSDFKNIQNKRRKDGLIPNCKTCGNILGKLICPKCINS